MMRRNYHEFCEYPVQNAGGEAIPAFACMQVSGYLSFQIQGEPVVGFSVKKPDGKGKLFLINSPYEIPVGAQGDATDSPGSFVLYEGTLPESSDGSLVEWGPKKDSWAISKDGKGFVVIGQDEGNPASEPGFPPLASTKRVRVAMITVAKTPNRITGTVAMTTTPATIEFPIQDISVLSGEDPRPEPRNPAQTVIVQNNLRKAYQNGVDRVIAQQSDADRLWYVETPTEAVTEETIFIARVTGPSGGIPPAVYNPSSSTGYALRMFKGYGVRYTVKDIDDPGFGSPNDMAEPESEDSLSITWQVESHAGSDEYPDSEEREGSVTQRTTLELINWVRARINVGDRVVIAKVTTQRGRVRYLIIARDCGE